MEKIRRHYVFSGYVQGVGFRYTARHTADRLGVTGWVRNCADGTVEMEAEGTRADLTELLAVLENHSYGTVSEVGWENIPLKNDSVFAVLY